MTPLARFACFWTTMIVLGLGAGRYCAGADSELENKRTEPVVSENEAALLKEVNELARKDIQAAIEKLRIHLTKESSAALDFALGVLLSREEKFEDSEKAYYAATGKLPRFARAWEALGRVCLMQDRPGKAAPAFRNALKYGEFSADLWKLLGYSYLISERPLAAEFAYRQALVFDPENQEIVLGLVKTLLLRERYKDALPLLCDLCASEPLNGDFWLLQANAYLEIDKQDRALELMECAYRLGILNPDELLTLGDLYYNEGLFDSAIQRYDLVLKSGNVLAGRIFQCAEALFQTGRIDDASRYLSEAQKRGLEKPATGFLLEGRIAESRSDMESARKAYEKTLEADPMLGEALVQLGNLYWRTKEYEKARIALERATCVPGFEVQALVTMAQLEVELDHLRKAIEHLEAAQEINSNPRVARYLEQIRRLSMLMETP